MQLDARVIRPGQAAPAQAAGLHVEVAAILLHHHVRSHLAGAEQRVLALVDGEALRDALRIALVRIVPAGLLLLQLDRVRRIPVDLVGRHVREGRSRAGAPHRLEHVEGADRIGVEIVERDRGGAVVTRLGRGVHDGVRFHRFHEIEHTLAISQVELVVLETGDAGLEPSLVPAGIPLRPKKTLRWLLSTPWICQPRAAK